MTDFEREVRALLGLPLLGEAYQRDWQEIELQLGVTLPGDYKRFVSSAAPATVNGKLYLLHPARERWNLAHWVARTANSFRAAEWADLPEPLFSGKSGLVPGLASDEGHVIFLRIDSSGVVVHVGDGDCVEYSMAFSEWLYRLLAGEEMLGPDSAFDYDLERSFGLPGVPRFAPLE